MSEEDGGAFLPYQPTHQRPANPWRWIVVALAVMGLCTVVAVVLLFREGGDRDRAIQELAQANQANERAVEELCLGRLDDPTCEAAEEIPDTSEIIDEAEVQDAEVQEPEVQDAEVQEPEVQEPEVQQAEDQQAEGQDPEVQDPEVQDPEVQDREVQDPEVDDPDPNSLFNFEVADECQPEEGTYVSDVGIEVRRGGGAVTYVVTCARSPLPRPTPEDPAVE